MAFPMAMAAKKKPVLGHQGDASALVIVARTNNEVTREAEDLPGLWEDMDMMNRWMCIHIYIMIIYIMIIYINNDYIYIIYIYVLRIY